MGFLSRFKDALDPDNVLMEVMNGFIEVVVSIKGDNFSNYEDSLQRWFVLIRKIKNQPNGGNSRDINPKLKQ